MNSIEEKYHEQTAVAENFDKKIKEEEKAEQEIARLETELQNAQKELEKIRQERKEIQEKMRQASLACAEGLSDHGKILIKFYITYFRKTSIQVQ